MFVYTLFIFTVIFFLLIDYNTNLKLRYSARCININHVAIVGAFSIIIVFGGLRYEIGYDYPKYLAGFLFDSELEKWEPFFNATVYFLREFNFGLDSQILFLFYTVFTVSILYLAIRRLTNNYRTALLIYLLIPAFYLNSFSVIRQGIAMVILLYGLQYLTLEYKPKKYIIFVLLAYMFHSISIVIGLIYLLFGRFFQQTYSWITYISMLIGSLVLYVSGLGKLMLTYAPGHYHLYLYHYSAVNPLKLLVVNGLFLFLMFQKKYFIKTRLDSYLLNSIFVGSVIFNIFADYVDVTRVAQYFLMAEIILVPLYIYTFKSSIKKNTVLVLFLAYYIFNFEYALYRDKVKEVPHGLIPYRNYVTTEIKSDKEKYKKQWLEFYKKIGIVK